VHLHGDFHFHLDGAHGDFLWPQIVPGEIAPSAQNDDVLVFRIKFRERSLLLSGDAEKLSEHHILSERLRQAAIPTLRTDGNGAIHILTDGKILQVSCSVAGPEITAQVDSAKPQTPQDQQSNQQQ
jgi:beta-lactamase superfamily II metal-dependent hydrolase